MHTQECTPHHIWAFLRASAHGAERVNGLYRQYQRDEGGGWVTNFLETFVKYVFFLGLQHWNLCQHRLLMPLSSNLMSEAIQALRNLTLFSQYSFNEGKEALRLKLFRSLDSN